MSYNFTVHMELGGFFFSVLNSVPFLFGFPYFFLTRTTRDEVMYNSLCLPVMVSGRSVGVFVFSYY